MEKRKNVAALRRMVCGLLVGSAVLLAPGGAGQQAHATGSKTTPTAESIKEKENQISQIKEEKESLKDGLSDLQEIKKNLEQQKDDLKNYVKELDGNLEEIEAKIADLKEQISAKEAEIQQTQAELEAARKREEEQLEAMSIHIRLTYESGEPNMVDLLLQSKSFGDFLNTVDYVEKMVASDNRMWQEYRAAKEYVQLCKEKMELEKEILDETKENVEIEQKNLEELIVIS